MIGFHSRWRNLAMAVGHAMLGLTLSAGTGRALADLLRHDKPHIDLTPFDPARIF